MSYLLIIVGVVFVVGAVFVWLKSFKVKEIPGTYKARKKVASFLFIVGIAIIGGGWGALPESDKNNKTSEEISWNLTATKNCDTQKVRQLLGIFQAQCVGLQKYPEAIESATINIRKIQKTEFESYAQKELGWYTEIELDIKIKNDAKLPTHLRMVPGHNLHYFIGGGIKPGILMIKDVTALFLGVPKEQINSGSNTFVSNEAYKIADEILIEE